MDQLVKKSVGYSTNDLLETDAVKKLLYNALYDVSGLEPSHWSKISGLSKIFKVRLKNWIAFEQFEVAKFTSRRSIMVRIHLLKPLVCDCYSICGVFRLLRLPTFHNIFTINLYVL